MDGATNATTTTTSDPREWVDRHGDALFRYAMLHTRDQERAEEIVQETFLAALRGKDRFAGQSTERTWLIGILRRKVVDDIRRSSRETVTDDVEVAASGADPFTEKGLWKAKPARWGGDPGSLLEQGEFWDVLRHCLSGLPKHLAGAFLLRELDGVASEEVCQVLDITPTNLWARLHRARLGLRKCLEANWFAGGKGAGPSA